MQKIEGFVPLKRRAACIVPMPETHREACKAGGMVGQGRARQYKRKWSKLARALKAHAEGKR